MFGNLEDFYEDQPPMKSRHVELALVATLPMTLAGCQGVVWGNMAALGVTVCLFFGTLQLGRRPPTSSSPATPSSDGAKRVGR